MGGFFDKYKITFIYILSLIVVAGVSIIIIFTTKEDTKTMNKSIYHKKPKPNNTENVEEVLTLLQKDNEFEKPNIKLNGEFELVKMRNGMTGILISDSYALRSYVEIILKYGSYIDTVGGLSHFGEHMILQGSEKYGPIFPVFNYLDGIYSAEINAMTGGNSQMYYVSLPYNYQYEKAIDILVDAFRHPLYLPDIVKNEIEAVNHEFYEKINSNSRERDIIRQLASPKTAFKGTSGGNNETLKKSESELLSKKLKGYHMVVKNPNNLFFILYSNKTLNESEELSKKYFNYTMHNFSDDEIDVEDKNKLEENIKNLESVEIFDENIYKHGFYYNSSLPNNKLDIYYYIGTVDYKKLKFDIVDYYNYLFNSKSLFDILKNKEYITMVQRISAGRLNYINNNEYFIISLGLTEKGLNGINDIILIINKYIELMKEEGYKKEYFNNFVQYMNNKDIIKFRKNDVINRDSYLQMFYNYHNYENNSKILRTGDFSEDNYDENILKKHLNLIKSEKSFYGVNVMNKTIEIDNFKDVLKSPEKINLNYYNSDFILGSIPDEILNQINDKTFKIDNLKIREINPYFSSNYNKTVIPCYKEQNNSCQEKNEFDFENEEYYQGTKLEDNQNYETYYQIDKSSESHLVLSHLEILINELDGSSSLLNNIIENYIRLIISRFSELDDFIVLNFDIEQLVFDFQSFSDNTEEMLNNFITLLKETPSEENFKYIKSTLIYSIYQSNTMNYQTYVESVFRQFLTKRRQVRNIAQAVNLINDVEYEDFKELYLDIFKNINSVKFKIAGNINESLVLKIHNHIKKTMTISTNKLLKKTILKDNGDEPYVINYYQKSTLNEAGNGILVAYEIPTNYSDHFNIFKVCFQNIAINYLRFNYSNAYTPSASIGGRYFIIFERGLYKDVDQMEDDINNVLLDIIEGKIDVKNYNEIRESQSFQLARNNEKNFDKLFFDFVYNISTFTPNKKNITYPQNFKELVNIISPVFINPKRITILIAKNDLSDEGFQKMFNKRSEIKSYSLNNNININHTIDINYSI